MTVTPLSVIAKVWFLPQEIANTLTPMLKKVSINAGPDTERLVGPLPENKTHNVVK